MTRRTVVLAVVVVGTTVGVLLAVAGAVVAGAVPCGLIDTQPRCEVALLPGPTEDALGLVTVEGTPTFPSAGELLLTTIAVRDDLDLATWWEARRTPTVSVVSRETIYPPDEEEGEVDERNALLMEDSQTTATVVALEQLGYDVAGAARGARVTQVTAAAVTDELAVGDVVTAADGAPVRAADDLVDAVAAGRPGDRLVLEIAPADGAPREVTVTLGADPARADRARIGVLVATAYDLPVDVRIDAGVVGGPSAGLMFALSVVDLLEEEDLTGGASIAGTGVLTADGDVVAVGGVGQKIVAATDRAGGAPPATVFLVPAGNLAEASRAPVDGAVLLVPVDDLDDAIAALGDLRAGREPLGALALGVTD